MSKPIEAIPVEQAALGCVLENPDYCLPICEREGVGERWFFDRRYGRAYTLMREMHRSGKQADEILLAERLKAQGMKLEVLDLSALRDVPSSPYRIEEYLGELKRKFIGREIKQAAQKAEKMVDSGGLDAPGLIELGESLTAHIRHSCDGDKLPAIVDAAELATKPPTKPAELIYGLLHQGSKLVLGGGSKSFKTWSLTDMALAVAHGEPWLSLKTAKGRVLYLNLEIQPWAFAERLQAVARAKNLQLEPGRLDVWNLRGKSAGYAEVLPKIREAIEQARYALIVLDPIYKLLGGADENSAGDIGAMMNAVEGLAVSSGAAVAFGAHFSKGNQSAKESIDRISGSGVFARDPDSILVMTQHEQAGAFTVDCTLRNFKPIEPFVIRWDYPLFRRDESLDPAKLKQAKGGRPNIYTPEMLLDVLGRKRLSTTDWLKKSTGETGIGRTKFFELVRELQAEKRIEKDGKELWSAKSTK